MRVKSLVAAALFCLLALPAYANPPLAGLVGNDTGGIPPWSPWAEQYRREIAADFCARYYKIPKITSVTRGYGNYIGFACRFPPRYDPAVTRLY